MAAGAVSFIEKMLKGDQYLEQIKKAGKPKRGSALFDRPGQPRPQARTEAFDGPVPLLYCLPANQKAHSGRVGAETPATFLGSVPIV